MSRVLCHMGSFVTGKARTMIHKVHRQRASGISHYSQSRVTGTDPSVSRPLTTTTKTIFSYRELATGSIDGVYRIRRLRVHA